MITISKLKDNFYPVDEIDGSVVRCGDELPKTTIHTYFMICNAPAHSPITVSDNKIDDEFAKLVLKSRGCEGAIGLTKAELAPNSYGFSHVLYVPPQYHSELKGRLDADRDKVTLCIPIFKSEFSGSETLEEFTELRKHVVPTYRWDREVTPKISLRFDNIKTKSGTGDGYVYARFEQVLKEVENLLGDRDGFIEILNYKNDVVEIVFSKEEEFSWIRNRDDAAGEPILIDAIRAKLWTFLTE